MNLELNKSQFVLVLVIMGIKYNEDLMGFNGDLIGYCGE